MQKDSSCEKKKSRKRRSKKVEEAPVEPIIEEEDESEYDDPNIEDEIEKDDGPLSEQWGNEDEESYEPDIDDIEREEQEAEEERKKAASEERKRIRRENKTINYVDPIEMEKRIEKFYESGEMSEELAMDIRRICDRLSMSARFVNYTYREEMAGDAFLSAYKAIYNKKFKLNCGYNPFSYVTQVAFHSMVQRIKTEHKEREKTDAYRDAHFDEFMKETMADQNAANEGIDSFDD